MTLKCDQNFEEKPTFWLKNDMTNSANFYASGGKSENLHSDGLILYEVCNDWAKKYKRVVSWNMAYALKNY